MAETKNLMVGLMDELERSRNLLKDYEVIGMAGMFGTTMLTLDIKQGEDAIRSGDVVKMLRAYHKLKENEG